MPTYWKYQTEHNREVGPVTFLELVQRVRQKQVNRETKVFSIGQKKWMFASDVFGLFYMSMREEMRGMFDELQEDASQLGFTPEELGELLEQAEEAGEELDEPSWQKRLREVARQRGAELAEQREQEREERYARRLKKGLAEAAEDAVARLDEEETHRERIRRVREFVGRIFSKDHAGQAFACVCAFVVANLTAFGILNWTQTELQRYPDRALTAHSYQVFPVWGICSQAEYVLLLLPTMIVAAMAAYGGTRLIISKTDG